MESISPESTVKAAMNRVLEAEHESAAVLADATREADSIVEAARQERRRILDSARRRASRLHAKANDRRRKSVADLEADFSEHQADNSSLHELLETVVDAVAARLTGAN